MDVGCYCVSALRLMCGEPERVCGEQVVGGDGVDVRFAGLLRFAGDVLGDVRLLAWTRPPQRVEVVGDAARSPSRRRGRRRPAPRIASSAGTRPSEIGPEAVDPYARELEGSAARSRRRAAAARPRRRARPGPHDRGALPRRRDRGRRQRRVRHVGALVNALHALKTHRGREMRHAQRVMS